MQKKVCESILNCAEEKTLFLVKDNYHIQQCRKCGHRFIQLPSVENRLKEVFSDPYFFDPKEGCYPDYLRGKDILDKAGLSYAKIVSKYTTPGKVLDVGCAAGFILKGFEKAGWIGQGLEPNDTMASYGRTELNLDIHTGGFETYETDEKFDLVNWIQVMCTFHDVDKALINLHSMLVENGLALVESWDMKSFTAKIMGKYWHEYCPPSVLNWYSDKTLIGLFNYHKFELIAKGRPVKRIMINHALARFDEGSPKFPFKKRMLKFFDRAVGKYSMRYPPMDLKWYIFRKL